MSQDLLIDLPDEIIHTLKLKAEIRGCDLEALVREILTADAKRSPTPAESKEQT